MATYTVVKDLPHVLQIALRDRGYNRADIEIQGRDKVCIQNEGGDGCRAFVVLVNLTTSTFTVLQGSWGGANIFNPQNVVDMDSREHIIPPNCAVISGLEIGGHPTIATLYLHPSNLVKYLPPTVDLSDAERRYLRQLATLKAGYRSKPSADILQSLLIKGFVKRNKAGSVQITTAGKCVWR